MPPGDGQQPDHWLRVVRVDAVVALHQDLRRGLRAARQGCRHWANHDLDLNRKRIHDSNFFGDLPIVYCREKLPGFWGQVGPVVMREHYGQLCDDLEECQSHSQARLAVPSCEACTNRIGLRADFLGAEETIVLWTSTLMEWCAGQEAGEVQECQEAVQWGVPLALPALSQADRGWVQGFCIVWTACSP